MENQKTKGKKMCNRKFQIVSKNLERDGKNYKALLEFKGCDNLIIFICHAQIMNWKEFDYNIIEKFIRNCDCGEFTQEKIDESLGIKK
jgi:hypothetical protein